MTDTGFGRRDVAAAAPESATGNELPFQFTGSGKEYFGIWIVNILLTIITIGIYSAWAKVRNKRYFNGNTDLDGHRFDYHANPIQILKGRIIVVVILIALNLLAQLHPALSLVVLAFYLIALPWVIVRGLRFNANMTSYRNLRFHFEGTKWNAFWTYILLPALPFLLGAVVIALYALVAQGSSSEAGMFLLFGGLFLVIPIIVIFTIVLIPFISRANARFLGNGHSYGQSHFAADPPLKPYYKGLGIALLIVVIPLIIAAALAYPTMSGATAGLDAASFGMAQIGVVISYFGVIVAAIAYAAVSRNVGFNVLSLQNGHRFRSTLTIGRYSWIIITNFLLTIITIGLYIPWAKVRVARYLADNTFMIANGDLDRFVEGQVDDRGVASGEFLDIEGIDFGF